MRDVIDLPVLAVRPKAVTRAVTALWVAFGSGLLAGLFVFYVALTKSALVTIFFLGVLSLALTAFIYIKISQGRNWARLTLLVLFTLSISPNISLMISEFSKSYLLCFDILLQMLALAYALLLLFTEPGKYWFLKEAPT